jgi:hypothetical protein
MNIKFSQIPKTKLVVPSLDTIPILRDYENLMLPVSAMYTYLSGDKLIDIYTSYKSNSAYYVKTNGPELRVLNETSTVVQRNSSTWNNTTSYVNSVSSFVNSISGDYIYSKPTLVPGSSAIRNIVALTQEAYDNLSTYDDYTYYIIAS